MTIIEVTVKDHYGVTRYYPANDAAQALARIAGTRTLTSTVLTLAESMGCTIRERTRTAWGVSK